MKTGKTIIEYLKLKPQFKPLGRHRCYRKYLDMLPPRFRNGIQFIYIKEETLFAALSHPGFKMEMELNRQTFLELAKMLGSNDNDCKNFNPTKVIFFNSKFAYAKNISLDTETIPFYNELSSGDFEVRVDNANLIRQFDKIKQNIKRNIQNNG